MKALSRKTVAGVIIMCALTSATALSINADVTPSILINGSVVESTVPPCIYNGTTMVPLRTISESLGANVQWDEATRSIHIEKSQRTVDLVIGEVAAKINGDYVTAKMAPTIVNGSTMVPLRFIGEALNCKVNWDGATKTVIIESGDSQQQPQQEYKQQGGTDAYGRTIRKTNLPSNAADFPYIAEGVPNWCYELQPTIMKNNVWGAGYYKDTELKGDTAKDVYMSADEIYPQNLSGGVYEDAVKFTNCQFNVNYNTLDEKWVNDILSCFSDTQIAALEKAWVNDPIKTERQDLESMISGYKKRQTVISSEVQVLPETMWVDYLGHPHFSVYVKTTIESDNAKPLLSPFFGESWVGVGDQKHTAFEVGKTYEGVVTYTLTKDSKDHWKIDETSCAPDLQLNPSTDVTDGVAPSLKDNNRLNSFTYWWAQEKLLVDRYAHPTEDQIYTHSHN
ncbi:MAG: copper amine oxidase N-terminal domain-containing protein [Firmicutes bacterium]|nr:copper amine oxidase N-terminal domain-containing protein [Bacillota bacterium]